MLGLRTPENRKLEYRTLKQRALEQRKIEHRTSNTWSSIHEKV